MILADFCFFILISNLQINLVDVMGDVVEANHERRANVVPLALQQVPLHDFKLFHDS